MSIFSDLCTFTKLKPRVGESYEDFAERVHKKVNTIADANEDLWAELSRKAQDWNNSVVPIFEQRTENPDLAVLPMEGYEPATEAEASVPQKTSPTARRRPQKAPSAEEAKPAKTEAKPSSKAKTEAKSVSGNSGAQSLAYHPPSDEALKARVAALEAVIVNLGNLFATIGGEMLDGAQPARKLGFPIASKWLETKAAHEVTDKKVTTPKKSGRQPRAGSMTTKITEVLAEKPLTTPELLQHFKISTEASNSFRQRLAQLTRAGRIANEGRGQPWHLT